MALSCVLVRAISIYRLLEISFLVRTPVFIPLVSKEPKLGIALMVTVCMQIKEELLVSMLVRTLMGLLLAKR